MIIIGKRDIGKNILASAIITTTEKIPRVEPSMGKGIREVLP
jgi:hypothetical protein